MELLLTGVTGFVGRNLLLKLLGDDRWSRIILPVRDPGKLQSQLAGEGIEAGELGEHLQIFQVSADAWELPSSIQPDLVIHAAGRLFGREQEEYFRTNVAGSLNLATQLPEKCRVIVLSSLAAGGPTPNGAEARTTEHDDAPVSYYGESKLAMERVLREKLGSRLLIFRPPMVLGPRDAATIPLFQMAKGFLRVKPGLKPKHYSWIAVDDLCDAIMTAASVEWKDRGPFYLSSMETITDTGLISTAAEAINSRGITLPLPHAVIQGGAFVLDSVPQLRDAVPSLGPDRVREILPDRWVCVDSFSQCFDWNPRRNLPETLRATARWLQTQGKI